MKDIFLCSISNVSSGNCGEDCGYCMQSAHNDLDIKTYKFKDKDEVLKEAKFLRSHGALGFCLVTSGRGLDGKKCEYIASLAAMISKEVPSLHIIACCGKADKDSLKYLKKNGVASYNHNLETAKSYFDKICTTHTWEERFQTNENVASVGLGICSGGIFGLGESNEQRHEFLKQLTSIKPHTVPINFFINANGLKINEPTMSKDEALECVKLAKKYLPNARLMIAGGREAVFGEDQKELFECGINAVVLGDYLITKGNTPAKEVEKIRSYGYEIAKVCH